MKSSKIFKKKSYEGTSPLQNDDSKRSSNVWTRHSMIFTNSKTQFFHGLLSLAQKQHKSLNESFEEDQTQKLADNLQILNKNDGKKNPFLMAKAKILIEKESQSIKTSNSSGVKSRLDQEGANNQIPLKLGQQKTKQTVTWKQVSALQNLKKRQVIKSLTDRTKKV